MRICRFTANALLLLLLGGLLMFGFTGCFGTRYKVDYDGQKDSYHGAKDSYRAGQQVELYFDLIATDTDYSFYLDGEPLNVGYSHEKGFEIRFVMPAHDVKLECRWKNSMVYEPEKTMLIDYYTAIAGTDGYDHSRELVLSETGPGEYVIEVFDTAPDGKETCVTYTVPEEAKTKCYELIKKYRFDKWETMDGTAIDGAVTTLKYRNDNNSYTRASTDNMPEDGERQLSAVGNALSAYLTEENRE